jgi:hypothetical protein
MAPDAVDNFVENTRLPAANPHGAWAVRGEDRIDCGAVLNENKGLA